MNFFLNYVEPNKKLIIDKDKSKRLVLDKEIIKVFEEKCNFPKEMPKPISLAELTNYYNTIWREGCSHK